MNTFILIMVRQPQIYARLQAEMDRVVGFERLPDFDDREALRYLNAVIKEVYRYDPAVPDNKPRDFDTSFVFQLLDGRFPFRSVSLCRVPDGWTY